MKNAVAGVFRHICRSAARRLFRPDGAAADPDQGEIRKGQDAVRDAAKAASVVGFCIYTSVSGLAASVEAKKEPVAQPQQKTETDSLHTMH